MKILHIILTLPTVKNKKKFLFAISDPGEANQYLSHNRKTKINEEYCQYRKRLKKSKIRAYQKPTSNDQQNKCTVHLLIFARDSGRQMKTCCRHTSGEFFVRTDKKRHSTTGFWPGTQFNVHYENGAITCNAQRHSGYAI